MIDGKNLPSTFKGFLTYDTVFRTLVDLHAAPREEFVTYALECDAAESCIANWENWSKTTCPTVITIL